MGVSEIAFYPFLFAEEKLLIKLGQDLLQDKPCGNWLTSVEPVGGSVLYPFELFLVAWPHFSCAFCGVWLERASLSLYLSDILIYIASRLSLWLSSKKEFKIILKCVFKVVVNLPNRLPQLLFCPVRGIAAPSSLKYRIRPPWIFQSESNFKPASTFLPLH